MDYAKLEKMKQPPGFMTRLRLAIWEFRSYRARPQMSLDLQAAPDRLLRDLGLERPSRAFDSSVAFWRDR